MASGSKNNVVAFPGIRTQPVSPTAIIGSTGLRQSGGFIDEEFMARLRGLRGVEFYRGMMDNNSILGSIMFIIKALVRQVPFKFEPASDKAEAKRWAEFADECFHDTSHTFEDFISEALSFLGYGWSYFEQVYKLRKGDTTDPSTRSEYSDGLIGLRKIEIRSQDTLWNWAFDKEDNGLRGMVQLDTWGNVGRGPVFIPIEKALLFRTETTKGNPEGKSLLRPSVRDYHYLTRIQEIEAVGIERDLAGMPVFEVPKELLMPNAGPEETALRRVLETMIQQVRVDERFGGLVPSEQNAEGLPSGFKFKLLSAGGKRQVDTNEIIKRYETRIAMTFLCEFIMIGQEKVGTQSLFQGKSNLFGIALGTLLDGMCSTINRYAISRLMQLNQVPREFWPKLGHGDVVSPDLDKLGAFVEKMAAAGLLSPNRQLEGKLLEMGNLPPPDEEDLAIFDDDTLPTPSSPEDQATGLLSDRQIEAILKINEQLASKKISQNAAAKVLSAALGMSPEHAKQYIEQDPGQLADLEAQRAAAPKPPVPGEKIKGDPALDEK